MRVLHVYRTYFPDTQGGLEETIRQICNNTRPHAVESRVFCLSSNPHPQRVRCPEADVYRAPLSFEIASCGFSLHALKLFRQQLAWADIVHYHFPWPFADLLHLLARVKKPTVVTYQADIVRQKGLKIFYQPLMNFFLSQSDRIVATSPNYVQSSPVLSKYSRKIQVIPIGLNRMSYPPFSASLTEEIQATVGKNFFLFVGVLRYYKGLHILLQAVKNTSLPVVIAGDGPEMENLRNMAGRLALNNVKFLGFVTDDVKVALFHLARGVVFPSHLRSEAFGVTLLEGAMFKKPLISAEIGSGMSYINQHGCTGITVPPSDPVLLRQAMQQLYNDPQSAAAMGQCAYQRYQQLFTGDRMGRAYFRLYSEMLHVKDSSLEF